MDCNSNLPIGTQRLYASPVYPGGQLQIAKWLTTRQTPFEAQLPGQGSIHFWFRQDLVGKQSELMIHSGRHDGGLPIYPRTQEQTPCPLIFRHWLFGPQGDGKQGLAGSSSTIS